MGFFKGRLNIPRERFSLSHACLIYRWELKQSRERSKLQRVVPIASIVRDDSRWVGAFLQTANARQNRAGSGYSVAEKKKKLKRDGRREGRKVEGRFCLAVHRLECNGQSANRISILPAWRHAGNNDVSSLCSLESTITISLCSARYMIELWRIRGRCGAKKSAKMHSPRFHGKKKTNARARWRTPADAAQGRKEIYFVIHFYLIKFLEIFMKNSISARLDS